MQLPACRRISCGGSIDATVEPAPHQGAMRTNLMRAFVLGAATVTLTCGPLSPGPDGGTAGGEPGTIGGGSSAAGGSAAGGSAAGGEAGGSGTAGGSTAGGSTAGGSTAGGSTAGGSTAGGSTAGGSTAGGSIAGGNTAGGSTAGGSTAGGSAAGGSTAGGSTAGGSTAGGSTAGGSAAGGSAAGGSAAGGGAGGSNVIAFFMNQFEVPSLPLAGFETKQQLDLRPPAERFPFTVFRRQLGASPPPDVPAPASSGIFNPVVGTHILAGTMTGQVGFLNTGPRAGSAWFETCMVATLPTPSVAMHPMISVGFGVKLARPIGQNTDSLKVGVFSGTRVLREEYPTPTPSPLLVNASVTTRLTTSTLGATVGAYICHMNMTTSFVQVYVDDWQFALLR
jgi:hypothetical protein